MNRESNALVGLFVFAGFAWAYPIAAAIIGGLILAEMLIRWLLRSRAQGRQSLTDNERMLRRASRPVGIAVVAFAAVRLFHLRAPYDAVAVFTKQPAAYWLPAVLLACVVLYGVAVFITGLFRCSNPRDGTTSRAVYSGCAGAAVAVYLWQLKPAEIPGLPPQLVTFVFPVLLLVAIWFSAVAAARVLMLGMAGLAETRAKGQMEKSRFRWPGTR